LLAENLEQLVGLQVTAVDGLATQMELLKTKMAMCKEQHGAVRFKAYRDSLATTR
jgi:hypothetical protein